MAGTSTEGGDLALHPGWQAQLRVVVTNGDVYISKTFGVAAGWTRKDAMAICRCAERYRKWVTRRGVPVLQSSAEAVRRVGSEWQFTLVQPYIGPDLDARLETASVSGLVNQRMQLLEHIIMVGVKLALSTRPPLVRCEVKPRDFCIAPEGRIVMVDTFPPVIAKRGRTFVVASRREISACLAMREREEVLAVTGTAVGVLRNLCEHLIAILPALRTAIIHRVTVHTDRVSPATSRELVAYFGTEQSVNKIKLLMIRRHQPAKT